MDEEFERGGEVRTCFVISPLGDEGSPTRSRSDDVLEFIIAPALQLCGYKVPPLRADQLPNPGRITRQIIDQLLKADLVVADLTDHNPNVFYELAIRHACRKPVVQIIHVKDRIPFDVANQRTIFYDHENLRRANRAMQELVRQIETAEIDPGEVDTPLAEALLIDSLSQSGDPVARSNAEIMAALQDIRSQLDNLGRFNIRAENVAVRNVVSYEDLRNRVRTIAIDDGVLYFEGEEGDEHTVATEAIDGGKEKEA